MGKIVLHQMSFSAPCRAAQMVADVLNLDIENKTVDLMKGEQMTTEYLKINPHHTIPTLVDEDGFALYESRAIISYLASKYASGSSLYPQDVKKRALVDQALFFDGTTLYQSMASAIYPVIRNGTPLDVKMVSMLDDKLALLNDDLGRTPYVAGNELTIADLSILATYTAIEAMGVWKTSGYANIHAWIKRIKDSGKIKQYDTLVVDTAKKCGDWIQEKLRST